MSKPARIALITASTRPGRLGTAITTLVHERLSRVAASHASAPALTVVDLAEQNLPLFNEPSIPMTIKESSGYIQPHTRAWSETIKPFDAFVFITPQYNWSIPASLKNALDYLFHEWNGKPAMVISYGGRGGDKAALALLEVLKGLRTKPVEETVQLPLGEVEGGHAAIAGQGVFPAEKAEEAWKDKLDKAAIIFERELL